MCSLVLVPLYVRSLLECNDVREISGRLLVTRTHGTRSSPTQLGTDRRRRVTAAAEEPALLPEAPAALPNVCRSSRRPPFCIQL